MALAITLPAIAQTDYTSKVKNTQAAWGGTGTYTAGGTSMVEYYQAQHFYRNALCQTIKDLPIGNYEAEVYFNASCADWECTAIATDGDKGYTHLYANDSEVDIPIYNTRAIGTPGLYTLTNIHVTDGVLRIGSHNDREAANWHLIRCKSLTYLGVDAKSLYEGLFPLVRKANDTKQTILCPDDLATLDECIAAALAAKEEDGVEQLQQVYDNLNDAITNATALQKSYNTAKGKLKTAMTTFQRDWNNGQEVHEEAWNTLLPAVQEAALAKDQTCDVAPIDVATTKLNEAMDMATGIANLEQDNSQSSIFNLQSSYRLNGIKNTPSTKGTKGIIITRGKKVIK